MLDIILEIVQIMFAVYLILRYLGDFINDVREQIRCLDDNDNSKEGGNEY